MATWKEKYNKKYGYEKDKSHTLSAISKKTGVSKAGLQKIYNKGIGAWKTNIGSVRLKKDFSKNPNTSKYPRKARLGKEQWAMARVYSAVMGGKASKVDKKELRMLKGGELQNFYKGYYERLTPSKMQVTSSNDGKIIIDVMRNDKLRQGGAVETDLETDAILGEFFAKGGETSIKPNKFIYHTSPIVFRDKIEKEGLKPQKGEQLLTTTGLEKPAIFFSNSKNKNEWFDSQYNDDVYKIDTSKLNNKFYKDPNFDSDKFIITFESIDPKYIKIIHKGDGNEKIGSKNEYFKKGGETDFNPDGKIKDKIVHASGEAGGMLVGKRHSKGGIKAINKSTGQPLEMEGGEVVITRDAVSDPKKRSFNGKMMTNRQILSAINESGGGVSFADGGEVPADVCFDCNAEYEYGGKTMCGKDLAYAMGGVTTAIVTDPNEAMADLQATYGFGDVYADGGEVEEIFEGVFEEGGETKIEVYEPSKDTTVIFLESKINELRNNFDKKRAITSNLQKGLMLREIRKYETLLYNHKTKKRPKGKLLKDFVKGSKLRFGNMDAERTPASTKTDLTKEESKLVRTESFIDWFGDWELAKETGNYTGVSKVIDEKTKEPLVVYHGTDTLFTSWETYTSNNLHYFAKKRKFAEFFATSWQFRTDQTAKDSAIIKNQNPFKGTYIYPCFLQIKNPIDLSVFGVDKKPIKTYLDYLKVKYDIYNFDWVANNVTTYTDFKTPVYSWMIIRMWQSFNLFIKNNTPFDGFIFYEYIPDSAKNGLKDASLCYTTFNSEQIKFANASTFNKNKDSRFYYGGEI